MTYKMVPSSVKSLLMAWTTVVVFLGCWTVMSPFGAVSVAAQYVGSRQTSLAKKLAFIEEPRDVITKVGERVVLPCRVANVDSGMVQWTKNSFGLGASRETDWPNYRMIGEDPKSK